MGFFEFIEHPKSKGIAKRWYQRGSTTTSHQLDSKARGNDRQHALIELSVAVGVPLGCYDEKVIRIRSFCLVWIAEKAAPERGWKILLESIGDFRRKFANADEHCANSAGHANLTH
jgi:hypothetical protein